MSVSQCANQKPKIPHLADNTCYFLLKKPLVIDITHPLLYEIIFSIRLHKLIYLHFRIWRSDTVSFQMHKFHIFFYMQLSFICPFFFIVCMYDVLWAVDKNVLYVFPLWYLMQCLPPCPLSAHQAYLKVKLDMWVCSCYYFFLSSKRKLPWANFEQTHA